MKTTPEKLMQRLSELKRETIKALIDIDKAGDKFIGKCFFDEKNSTWIKILDHEGEGMFRAVCFLAGTARAEVCEIKINQTFRPESEEAYNKARDYVVEHTADMLNYFQENRVSQIAKLPLKIFQ